MAEEILDLGDVRLCVGIYGASDHPTILLISGAAESMDGWDPAWCRQLAAAGRRVVRYDHRDSGRSTSSPPGHRSYPANTLSRDVLRLLDALDADRAHLVGLSMGGGIGQEVAALHPDRVATLTLIATSPAGRRSEESPLPPPEPRVVASFESPPSEPDWTDRHAAVEHLVAGRVTSYEVVAMATRSYDVLSGRAVTRHDRLQHREDRGDRGTDAREAGEEQDDGGDRADEGHRDQPRPRRHPHIERGSTAQGRWRRRTSSPHRSTPEWSD